VSCGAAPQQGQFTRRFSSDPRFRQQLQPQGQERIIDTQVGSVLRNAPYGSQLIRVQPQIPALLQRLPDNATLIRPNLVDSFRCQGRGYGYYGDTDNECQVFHVCLPLRQLYPANFTADVTYQFSFICPQHTIFSQDAMVCAWDTEALPCEAAPQLYWMNDNFFRRVPDEDGYGERYAHLSDPLPSGGAVSNFDPLTKF